MLRLWLTILLATAGAILTIATFLPLLRADHWWIRIVDFPRLQISALIVLVVILWLLLWSPEKWWYVTALAVFIGALVYHAVLVNPYTPVAKTQVSDVDPVQADGHPSIRLFIANVLQENRDSEKLLQMIEAEAPDIVLIVENDAWWSQRLEPITERLPHRVSEPIDNTYGMDLFSRFPLHNVTVRELTAIDVPSIRCEVEVNGERVLFYGLHPPPPWPDEALESTARDAELVIVAREIKENSGPAIVAGDLNDVAWSATTSMFQEISRLLDPRIGRGLYNSFSAQNKVTRWPLDHVFFSDDFSLVELRRMDAFGSDHFPILLEISFAPPIRPHRLPEPNDPDTDEMAEEKLEEQAEEGKKAPGGD